MIANTPQYPPLKTLEGSRVDARPEVAASEQLAVATEAGSSWQCLCRGYVGTGIFGSLLCSAQWLPLLLPIAAPPTRVPGGKAETGLNALRDLWGAAPKGETRWHFRKLCLGLRV